jgi:hypothetical protein
MKERKEKKKNERGMFTWRNPPEQRETKKTNVFDEERERVFAFFLCV